MSIPAEQRPGYVLSGGVAVTATKDLAVVQHLDQRDLARRWKLSARTLERWRWLRIGPSYLKIGNRIVYRAEDVVAYEAARLRGSSR